jgi:hypothetical protein
MDTMRFYGWTWDYIMAVPLRLFWALVKNKNRIEARDTIKDIRKMMFPNLAENSKMEYISDQQSTLGVVAVTDERDEEGINKLKNL